MSTRKMGLLYVKPLPDVDVCETYALFRRYGIIRDIRYISNTDIFCIDGAFNTDERNSRKYIKVTIYGQTFRLRYDFRNPYEEEPSRHLLKGPKIDKSIVAPFKHSPQNIMHALSDYCLLHIFKKLDKMGLYEVAYVCERFKSLAQQAYRAKFKRDTLSPMNLSNDYLIPSLFRIDNFVRTFGSDIHNLRVCREIPFSIRKESDLNKEVVLGLCVEHCPQIEVLEFIGDHWTACLEADIRLSLPRLKRLTLDFNNGFYWCSDSMLRGPRYAMGDLFVGDWPLQKLEIRGRLDWDKITIKMPELIELSLMTNIDIVQIVVNETAIFRRRTERWIGMDLTEQHVTQILSGNPQIRKIELENFRISSTSGFDLLPTYLPNCQEITFNDCIIDSTEAVSSTEWRKFKSLEALHIYKFPDFPTTDILETLAVNEVPLKHLTLSTETLTINDLFVRQYITPLKHLETVEFFGFVPDIDIHQLASSLEKLSEISFTCLHLRPNEIKEFIELINGPVDLSIQFNVDSFIDSDDASSDYAEINELLQAHPNMRFEVKAGTIYSDIPEIILNHYWLHEWLCEWRTPELFRLERIRMLLAE